MDQNSPGAKKNSLTKVLETATPKHKSILDRVLRILEKQENSMCPGFLALHKSTYSTSSRNQTKSVPHNWHKKKKSPVYPPRNVSIVVGLPWRMESSER